MACQLVSLIHALEEEKVARNALEEEEAGKQRESVEGNLEWRREGAREGESAQVLVERPAHSAISDGFFCVSADVCSEEDAISRVLTHARVRVVVGGAEENQRGLSDGSFDSGPRCQGATRSPTAARGKANSDELPPDLPPDLAADLAAAEHKFRQLDAAGTLLLPLPQVLKLADWVWGQFTGTNSDGACLTPAERGRLASRLLRHHCQDGHELELRVIDVLPDSGVTCLALEDFLRWYRTVREAAAQALSVREAAAQARGKAKKELEEAAAAKKKKLQEEEAKRKEAAKKNQGEEEAAKKKLEDQDGRGCGGEAEDAGGGSEEEQRGAGGGIGGRRAQVQPIRRLPQVVPDCSKGRSPGADGG